MKLLIFVFNAYLSDTVLRILNILVESIFLNIAKATIVLIVSLFIIFTYVRPRVPQAFNMAMAITAIIVLYSGSQP